MEEKEEVKTSSGRSTKSKITTVLLGISLFCVLSCLLLVIFVKDNGNTNQGNNSNNTNNNNNNNSFYYIVDGEDFVLYSDLNRVEKQDITFDYPQFNVDTLKDANNAIKDLYESRYKELKEVSSVDEGQYYLVKDNKKFVNDSGLFLLKHTITENDKYLSLYIEEKLYENASGNVRGHGYVYDKLNKKLMTKEEILKLFDLSKEEFIDYYNKNAGCQAAGEQNKLTSIDNIGIFIIGEKLYFDDDTCCCKDVSEYNAQ